LIVGPILKATSLTLHMNSSEGGNANGPEMNHLCCSILSRNATEFAGGLSIE
jgi:hypothetical protein